MTTLRSKIIIITGLLGSALLPAVLTPVAAQSQDGSEASRFILPPVSGGCAPNALKYKVSRRPISTTETSFVTVSETDIHFTQAGPGSSCVIVSFSAEAKAAADTIMVVETRLDGTACLPSGNYFVQSTATEAGIADHAMNYVCRNVAPGNHTVVMKYLSNVGGAVNLDFRTTIVHYRQ
jgi:hypothetical protein